MAQSLDLADYHGLGGGCAWRLSSRFLQTMSAIGTKRTLACAPHMSAFDPSGHWRPDLLQIGRESGARCRRVGPRALAAGHGSAPELYERYLVPAITRIWASDLIDRVGPKPGQSLLDVACGTGVVARLAAERMRNGRVVGLDLNEGMLAVARSVPVAGAPIEWREGSALSLPFEDRSFDLVLCQLGVQFFPDRSLALREMKRVLVASGLVALSVYSDIERTPVADAFVKALDQCFGAVSK